MTPPGVLGNAIPSQGQNTPISSSTSSWPKSTKDVENQPPPTTTTTSTTKPTSTTITRRCMCDLGEACIGMSAAFRVTKDPRGLYVELVDAETYGQYCPYLRPKSKEVIVGEGPFYVAVHHYDPSIQWIAHSSEDDLVMREETAVPNYNFDQAHVDLRQAMRQQLTHAREKEQAKRELRRARRKELVEILIASKRRSKKTMPLGEVSVQPQKETLIEMKPTFETAQEGEMELFLDNDIAPKEETRKVDTEAEEGVEVVFEERPKERDEPITAQSKSIPTSEQPQPTSSTDRGLVLPTTIDPPAKTASAETASDPPGMNARTMEPKASSSPKPKATVTASRPLPFVETVESESAPTSEEFGLPTATDASSSTANPFDHPFDNSTSEDNINPFDTTSASKANPFETTSAAPNPFEATTTTTPFGEPADAAAAAAALGVVLETPGTHQRRDTAAPTAMQAPGTRQRRDTAAPTATVVRQLNLDIFGAPVIEEGDEEEEEEEEEEEGVLEVNKSRTRRDTAAPPATQVPGTRKRRDTAAPGAVPTLEKGSKIQDVNSLGVISETQPATMNAAIIEEKVDEEEEGEEVLEVNKTCTRRDTAAPTTTQVPGTRQRRDTAAPTKGIDAIRQLKKGVFNAPLIEEGDEDEEETNDFGAGFACAGGDAVPPPVQLSRQATPAAKDLDVLTKKASAGASASAAAIIEEGNEEEEEDDEFGSFDAAVPPPVQLSRQATPSAKDLEPLTKKASAGAIASAAIIEESQEEEGEEEDFVGFDAAVPPPVQLSRQATPSAKDLEPLTKKASAGAIASAAIIEEGEEAEEEENDRNLKDVAPTTGEMARSIFGTEADGVAKQAPPAVVSKEEEPPQQDDATPVSMARAAPPSLFGRPPAKGESPAQPAGLGGFQEQEEPLDDFRTLLRSSNVVVQPSDEPSSNFESMELVDDIDLGDASSTNERSLDSKPKMIFVSHEESEKAARGELEVEPSICYHNSPRAMGIFYGCIMVMALGNVQYGRVLKQRELAEIALETVQPISMEEPTTAPWEDGDDVVNPMADVGPDEDGVAPETIDDIHDVGADAKSEPPKKSSWFWSSSPSPTGDNSGVQPDDEVVASTDDPDTSTEVEPDGLTEGQDEIEGPTEPTPKTPKSSWFWRSSPTSSPGDAAVVDDEVADKADPAIEATADANLASTSEAIEEMAHEAPDEAPKKSSWFWRSSPAEPSSDADGKSSHPDPATADALDTDALDTARRSSSGEGAAGETAEDGGPPTDDGSTQPKKSSWFWRSSSETVQAEDSGVDVEADEANFKVESKGLACAVVEEEDAIVDAEAQESKSKSAPDQAPKSSWWWSSSPTPPDEKTPAEAEVEETSISEANEATSDADVIVEDDQDLLDSDVTVKSGADIELSPTEEPEKVQPSWLWRRIVGSSDLKQPEVIESANTQTDTVAASSQAVDATKREIRTDDADIIGEPARSENDLEDKSLEKANPTGPNDPLLADTVSSERAIDDVATKSKTSLTGYLIKIPIFVLLILPGYLLRVPFWLLSRLLVTEEASTKAPELLSRISPSNVVEETNKDTAQQLEIGPLGIDENANNDPEYPLGVREGTSEQEQPLDVGEETNQEMDFMVEDTNTDHHQTSDSIQAADADVEQPLDEPLDEPSDGLNTATNAEQVLDGTEQSDADAEQPEELVDDANKDSALPSDVAEHEGTAAEQPLDVVEDTNEDSDQPLDIIEKSNADVTLEEPLDNVAETPAVAEETGDGDDITAMENDAAEPQELGEEADGTEEGTAMEDDAQEVDAEEEDTEADSAMENDVAPDQADDETDLADDESPHDATEEQSDEALDVTDTAEGPEVGLRGNAGAVGKGGEPSLVVDQNENLSPETKEQSGSWWQHFVGAGHGNENVLSGAAERILKAEQPELESNIQDEQSDAEVLGSSTAALDTSGTAEDFGETVLSSDEAVEEQEEAVDPMESPIELGTSPTPAEPAAKQPSWQRMFGQKLQAPNEGNEEAQSQDVDIEDNSDLTNPNDNEASLRGQSKGGIEEVEMAGEDAQEGGAEVETSSAALDDVVEDRSSRQEQPSSLAGGAEMDEESTGAWSLRGSLKSFASSAKTYIYSSSGNEGQLDSEELESKPKGGDDSIPDASPVTSEADEATPHSDTNSLPQSDHGNKNHINIQDGEDDILDFDELEKIVDVVTGAVPTAAHANVDMAQKSLESDSDVTEEVPPQTDVHDVHENQQSAWGWTNRLKKAVGLDSESPKVEIPEDELLPQEEGGEPEANELHEEMPLDEAGQEESAEERLEGESVEEAGIDEAAKVVPGEDPIVDEADGDAEAAEAGILGKWKSMANSFAGYAKYTKSAPDAVSEDPASETPDEPQSVDSRKDEMQADVAVDENDVSTAQVDEEEGFASEVDEEIALGLASEALSEGSPSVTDEHIKDPVEEDNVEAQEDDDVASTLAEAEPESITAPAAANTEAAPENELTDESEVADQTVTVDSTGAEATSKKLAEGPENVTARVKSSLKNAVVRWYNSGFALESFLLVAGAYFYWGRR